MKPNEKVMSYPTHVLEKYLGFSSHQHFDSSHFLSNSDRLWRVAIFVRLKCVNLLITLLIYFSFDPFMFLRVPRHTY